MNYRECQYGFEYGSINLTRLFSDEKKGWVVVEVKSPKESLQIYATKTGKIRVFGNGEWLPKHIKENRTQRTTNKASRKAK